MACVDLPAFSLQLLLARHPDWRGQSVAVVDVDRPHGTILQVNEKAKALGIVPGMRYGAALSLAGKLRAAPVPPAELRKAVTVLARRLRRLTPRVEPADPVEYSDRFRNAGVFWLDAGGLERLHGSLQEWAGRVRSEVERAGFRATVVVGFRRFETCALARSRRGVVVLDDPARERAEARRVPLERIGLDPSTLQVLTRLGVTTAGAFADLPEEGISKRFGKGVLRLHRLASGKTGEPVQTATPEPPVILRAYLDHPETGVGRLMDRIEHLVRSLLEKVGRRGRAVSELRVGFRFERLGDHLETIRPASPTRSARQLLELIRLRLQAVRRLPDGVSELVLAAREARAEARQASLFDLERKRDPAAAARALARVRARVGGDAVVRARLSEGHMPEARFTWEPVERLPAPQPGGAGTGHLVRRILLPPVPLPHRPRQEPDGWMLRGLEQGPVVRVMGPYVISGGWWNRPVHREYHFAETRKGELLWVYYDRARRRWFLHGRVE